MRLKHFSPAEVAGLEPELAVRLDIAREHAGVPFRITSGFRTPERNAAVGGGVNSSHLRGYGADLDAYDSGDVFHIVGGLYFAGFRRIVVYKGYGHVHVDCDPSLPQNVLVIK